MSERKESVYLTASDDFYCWFITHLESRPDLHATDAYLHLVGRLLTMDIDSQKWPTLATAKTQLLIDEAEADICRDESAGVQ
jgi:hypothetical protein